MLRLMEEYIEKNPQVRAVRQVSGRTAPERDATRWEESVDDDEIEQSQYKERDEADERRTVLPGGAIKGDTTPPRS